MCLLPIANISEMTYVRLSRIQFLPRVVTIAGLVGFTRRAMVAAGTTSWIISSRFGPSSLPKRSRRSRFCHKNARLFNSLYDGTAPVLYLRREALMSTGEIATVSQAEHPERPANLALPARADFTASDERVKAIGADIFALKMLLPALLSRVGRLDPILGSAIQQGFQDAIDQIEHMIAACRWIDTRDGCSNALASIRSLRAAVLTELSSAPLGSAG